MSEIEKQLSVYSKKFLNKLKNTLGCYKKFAVLSSQKKINMSNKIKKLFIIEDFNKNFNPAKMRYSKNKLNSLLHIEKINFITNFDVIILKKSNRINSSTLRNIYKRSLEKIIKEIDLKDFSIDLENIVEITLSEEIFYITILSILEGIQIENDLLIISSVDFFYSLREHLIYFMFNKIIQLATSKKKYIIEILNKSLIKYKEMECIIQLSKQIEYITKISFLESFSEKRENSKHKNIYYILPKIFQDYIPVTTHLPEIIEPQSWGKNKYKEHAKLVKKIKNGVSNINYSKDTLLALEVSQKKSEA